MRTARRPDENDVVIVMVMERWEEMDAKSFRWDEESPKLLLTTYMVQKCMLENDDHAHRNDNRDREIRI
ncbi:unnamed protein product [Bursaphelenchus xylophilus]|uniref:(pine wood nematode) hypothetical protein n=1 Tax=Bursaphelenchus xylophilus TaxID=6326 RepID=A0A1I7SV12_BURXY|nr:unnamed protein product [Bursaphelenchus xylophilus]CAG9100720.1 unnamed protein product [Bursaphelenchus xylophilus]